MKAGLILVIACVLCATLPLGSMAAEPVGIVVDGVFDDWGDEPPFVIYPWWFWLGTKAGRPENSFASDAERLYIRFRTRGELNLQNRNDIVLYLDADCSEVTGHHVGALGAEFSWSFGERTGTVYTNSGSTTVSHADVGFRQGPTVSSKTFEISFDLELLENLVPELDDGRAMLAMRHTQSFASFLVPYARRGLEIVLSNSPAPTPLAADLGRHDPTHVRILSYNVLHNGLFIRSERFDRILNALQPDIICFQETSSHGAGEARDLVAAMLGGTPWHAEGVDDVIVVSRYPIADSGPVDDGNNGNLWALIDLPDGEYSTDLSLVNAHLPCCEDNDGRQNELDAIAAWHRELQSLGGTELAAGTPIVIAGDMNLVGFSRQVVTLLDGWISDQTRYGASHPADWDGTGLEDVMPYHTTGREAYTWRNDRESFAPGRLDYIVYSDSVMTLGNSFLLWTPDMSPEDLAAHGLEADDTSVASDHLPVVADFAVP